MEEIKEKAKEEVKKGIAEALEEMGAEMKGGKERRRNITRRRKISGILDRLRKGMNGRKGDIESLGEKDEDVIEGEDDTEAEELEYTKIKKASDEEEEDVKALESIPDIEEEPTGGEGRQGEEEVSEEETEEEEKEGAEEEEEQKKKGGLEGEEEEEEIMVEEKEEVEEEEKEGGLEEEREEEEERTRKVKDILEALRKGLLGEEEEEEVETEGGIEGGGGARRGEGEGGGGRSPSEEEMGESAVFESVTEEEGTGLPGTRWEGAPLEEAGGAMEEEQELTDVNEYYSLVPRNPESYEDIYAYCHITWNEEKNSLVYNIMEPRLSDRDEELLERIKDSIETRLDVDFEELGKIKAKGYLSDQLEEVLDIMGEELEGERKKAIKYYLERDFIGMGKIEPFMRDPNIEEISCDGVGIPIFVYHRNARYGSMETNITFEDEDELDTFVLRLGQTVGKTISMADPLVDASLPDGSRLQATLGTDIARKGSNFTIRKFTENPLTPVDLIEFETLDPRTLAYLWMAIEHQNSVLISGGTATGKTTMLNVISLFIKPEMKIVTIEDTAELRLPHDHWVPEVAREAMSSEETKTVDMFRLLKESLRQRPDYIVVGEVRGAEAFVLFQQMSTGHPGLATIHAETPERLIDRLTTEPINLPSSLLGALDIVIFLKKVRKGDRLVRKIDQLVEIKRFSREENLPKMNRVFSWDPVEDKVVNENPSIVLKEISEMKGLDEDELKSDLRDREKVIEWMVDESVRDIETIGEIIGKYYTDKETLLEKIEAGR
ncbi:MAG: type II/IV secretion system ATPase subunit [Candidatus Aenigmatarchaeota archaeon]